MVHVRLLMHFEECVELVLHSTASIWGGSPKEYTRRPYFGQTTVHEDTFEITLED